MHCFSHLVLRGASVLKRTVSDMAVSKEATQWHSLAVCSLRSTFCGFEQRMSYMGTSGTYQEFCRSGYGVMEEERTGRQRSNEEDFRGTSCPVS